MQTNFLAKRARERGSRALQLKGAFVGHYSWVWVRSQVWGGIPRSSVVVGKLMIPQTNSHPLGGEAAAGNELYKTIPRQAEETLPDLLCSQKPFHQPDHVWTLIFA